MMAPMLPGCFFASYALDWIAGDPPELPHPVRLIGAAISTGERSLRRPATPGIEMLQGGLLTALIVGASWAAARLVGKRAGWPGEVLLGWTALATRSLLDETAAAIRAVAARDLPSARRRLAMIVGRDTSGWTSARFCAPSSKPRQKGCAMAWWRRCSTWLSAACRWPSPIRP